MGPTTALRRELKRRLLPLAQEHGFVLDERNAPVSWEFRREAGERVHLFAIQWDKYGRPRFSLSFGTCPAEGLRLPDRLAPPEEVLPGWLPDAGSLQPRRGTSTAAWFRQDRTLLERILGRRPRTEREVVDELMGLFPELERYWASGRTGPHMRHFRLAPPQGGAPLPPAP